MLRLPDSLREHLESGGQLIVPSRQRAAAVRLAYAWQQQQRGIEVWRTPAVESLGGWAARQLGAAALRGALPAPRQLEALEEWLLWRRAAQRLLDAMDEDRPFGLSADALADRLQRAASVVGDYAIDRTALAEDASSEARWLAQALEEVEAEASKRRAIARHQRLAALSRLESLPGSPILQVGGSSMPRSWRSVLERFGVTDTTVQTTLNTLAQPRVAVCSDPQAELEAAAAWCAAHLRRNPQARLLVIVPELATRRAQVERIFDEQLAPNALLGERSPGMPHGFEGGRALAEYGEPREGLRILLALVRPSTNQDLAELLELEFWGMPGRAARARAASRLRRRYGGHSSPAHLPARLRTLCETLIEGEAQALEECAQRFERAFRALEEAKVASAGMGAALTEIGWAATTRVDSERQQIRDRWQERLVSFAYLANEAGVERNPQRAVDLWAALVRRDIFAPAAEDVAVTLTASLDHPVVRYDGIWVTALQADRWPQPRQFDALIPWYLQRAVETPGSSAELRLRQAQLALSSWQTADELVLSCAKGEAGEEWLPSPLLAGWPSFEPAPVASLASQLRAAASMSPEPYCDGRGPSFDVQQRIPGGTSALVDQHDCPFKAFARRRLGGFEADEGEPGIAATERGKFLHLVLHKFWLEVGTRTALLALDAGSREKVVQRAIQAAIDDADSAALRRDTPPRVLTRERVRAESVLLAVLDVEQERADFEVLASEHVIVASLAGARIQARIDRIDKVLLRDEQGDEHRAIAIIDYKTGKHAPMKFFGPKLSAIQLWTYALLIEAQHIEQGALQLTGKVEALANFHMTDRKRRYAAWAGREQMIPGVKADDYWSVNRQEAEQRVHALIKAFVAGEAQVQPREKVCERCDLSMLCRRTELGVRAGDDEWLESEESP